MPEVSVIIPVYNVGEYLEECLISVLNQTYKNIEIICVNDASTDSSAITLEKYAIEDRRLKVITHEKNQGLGAARNTGVANSNANFIVFVDSDDYVAPGFIETLLILIKINNAQMSWCGNNTISETGEFLNSYYIPDNVWTLEGILKCEALYPSILPVWNKMFQKELIKDIKQLPIVSEDQPALGEYFLKCKTIVTTSQNLYYYRQNKNSLSKPVESKPKLWNDFFYSHELFFKFLKSKYQDKNTLRTQAIIRHFSLLWRIITFNILYQADWQEHEKVILKHLKADKIGLKRYCSVMYFYLMTIFKIDCSRKLKKIGIETGMNLSRGRWLKRATWLLMPLDILTLFKPLLISKIKLVLDKIELVLLLISSEIFKFFFKKPIWLIGERPDTAQDNGIYFYRYLRNKHPEIEAYYIIDKKSSQYKNVENNNRVIQVNSIIHKLYFFSSCIYATSHNHYCFPVSRFGRKRFKLAKSTKNIFLQHGITFNNNSEYYGKSKSSIALFICGAQPEYEFIRKEFEYSVNEVKYTGFARFDGLHNFTVKRQILLMPTWRRKIWENRTKNNTDYFLHSTYFTVFNSFINNRRLHVLLKYYDYQLVFYPHYEIQPLLNTFETRSDRVILASKEKYGVQNLLKSSALLITDSSSVNFDFAYMHKPLIYYFFDRDDFEANHLKKGYFDHRTMGFGEVIDDEDQLVFTIERYLKEGCKIKEKYEQRIKSFFPLYDERNCERIYEAIKEIVDGDS